MGKIRVVVADDSSLARGLLRSFLESDSGIEVVGEARNGREAVDLTQRLKPNLVTMDLDMPIMDGMQAIEEIMATKAVPILVVSSVADAHKAYEAIARGALEVIAKPEYDPIAVSEFVGKVQLLASVPVITHIRSRTGHFMKNAAPLPAALASDAAKAGALPAPAGGHMYEYSRIFAIASSTGGPQALGVILSQLPSDFPCPVLVSQHISEGFAGGMADWLAGLCKMEVRLACDGEQIMSGVIYISPSEANLAVTRSGRLMLLARQPTDIYRPSCNALLNSVADTYGRQSVGIILTGMSSDGAQGIGRIRQMGGTTLAQDEASSVVFGMNKVAIDAGDVQKILSPDAIAHEMGRLAGVPTIGLPGRLAP